MMMSFEEDESSVRPKLNLQPRSSPVDRDSVAMQYSTGKPSPFGAARPREQVIAEREGKKETEVLKEQAQKDWKGNLTLSELQREEKKAAEAELAFARRELQNELDPFKLRALKEEVVLKERKLGDLLDSFERLAVQTAQSGGIRRGHEKIKRDDQQQDGFVSFSATKGRGRGDGPYDNWGGSRGRPSFSQCYTCGEVGHFSRECLNIGMRNNNYSYSRCYSCGEEGHYSRECPVAVYGAPNAAAGYTRGAY